MVRTATAKSAKPPVRAMPTHLLQRAASNKCESIAHTRRGKNLTTFVYTTEIGKPKAPQIKWYGLNDSRIWLSRSPQLRLVVTENDFHSDNPYLRVTFQDVFEVFTAPNVTDLTGYLHRTFHETRLTSCWTGIGFSGAETSLLHFLALGAISSEHQSLAARYLLHFCLVRDPTLRQPFRERYPWYWKTYYETIKQAEIAYQVEQTVWAFLAACPEYKGGDPQLVEAAHDKNVRRCYHRDGSTFNDYAQFIDACLTRTHKNLPVAYQRVLQRVLIAMTEEAQKFTSAARGADVLNTLKGNTT